MDVIVYYVDQGFGRKVLKNTFSLGLLG